MILLYNYIIYRIDYKYKFIIYIYNNIYMIFKCNNIWFYKIFKNNFYKIFSIYSLKFIIYQIKFQLNLKVYNDKSSSINEIIFFWYLKIKIF